MPNKDQKKRREYQQRYNRTPKRKKYMRDWQRKYRQTQEAKEYERKYRKEYRKLPKSKDRRRKYEQKYYKLPRVKMTRQHQTIKYRYGIDITEYDKLFKQQHGKCAICGKPPARTKLGIDHNHNTKKVRGLLCNKCNRALGYFDDSIQILQKAVKYMKKYEE